MKKKNQYPGVHLGPGEPGGNLTRRAILQGKGNEEGGLATALGHFFKFPVVSGAQVSAT